MKTKLVTLTLFLFGFLISTSIIAKNETRQIAPFSEVSLRISGTVYITQGNNQSVDITADSDVLDKIITEVNDRKLVIRFPKKTFFQRNFSKGNIIINITVPDIDGLFVSGSGDIVAKETIKSRILDLAISGSGNISLADLNSERVKASISGSGDIEIKDGGVADELSISISGSGDVKTYGFEAKNVLVKTAGSGDAGVYASDNLKVSIAGSGDVYYKGSAAVDAKVAGSGNVRRK